MTRIVIPALALMIILASYIVSHELRPSARVPDPVLRTPMTRESLRLDAFASSALPRTRPKVEHRWHDSRFPYTSRIDRLTIDLPHGFTSVAYHLYPETWNGRTVIFHNGHGQGVTASPHVRKWFLRRGWGVVAMAMPLAGENASPGVHGPTDSHDWFVQFERPLALFLLPVIAVLNHTGADVMVGLSGGGWTTSVAAAVDQRIRASYSIAGSLPWTYNSCPQRSCYADLEQRMIPNYLRLYELGSEWPRRQMALYTARDPCCFAGWSSDQWADNVRGNFAAVVDPDSRRHAVTAFHLTVITDDLAGHEYVTPHSPTPP